MNEQDIIAKLQKWLIDFVEVPNPKLGNWAPCPFARQARVNNLIGIKFATIPELREAISDAMEQLDNKEVVVVCFDHTEISPVNLQEFVRVMNQILMPMNYVILEDHPDTPEDINGVSMNFGECGLLVIQKLDKLNKASDQLKEKGYYGIWIKKDLDDVVTWRYK